MRRAARVDATAPSLVKAAKQLGAQYLPLNGVIDGLLLCEGGTRLELIDWKSPGGTLTPDQAKLVAAGWPIRFVSDVEQLTRLVRGR